MKYTCSEGQDRCVIVNITVILIVRLFETNPLIMKKTPIIWIKMCAFKADDKTITTCLV